MTKHAPTLVHVAAEADELAGSLRHLDAEQLRQLEAAVAGSAPNDDAAAAALALEGLKPELDQVVKG